jgi:hypothetical protein
MIEIMPVSHVDSAGLAGSVDAESPAPPCHWRLFTRIAFRSCFLYFILYVVCTQMVTMLLHTANWGAPNFGARPPVSTAVMWVIRHVFRDHRMLGMVGGSGDKMYDWVLALCLLMSTALLATIWSVLDRRRGQYTRLHRAFRVFLRFALGSTLIGYGAAKAVPLQMPYPPLTRLLEPYGNFSPMGVLWSSIGASRSYEIFTGGVELLCGILLFIPRTQLLGASFALAATVQVFALNMTYDVPVKLFSFHLVLMSLVLLAPDVRRVCQAVFYHRVKWPAAAAQVVFGAYLVVVALYGSAQRWTGPFGGGAPRPPFYGIWTIDRMTINSTERAPLVTDDERWRRVVIQNGTSVTFWRMDDTPLTYQGKIDLDTKTITLTPPSNVKSVLTVQQPASDRLILDGDLDGKKLHMETTYVDRSRFLLVNRGFNWIQEVPFNR